MQQKKTSILVVLIILLIIMVPLTILSIILKISNYNIKKETKIVTPEVQEIPENNQKYKDGLLYFYDEDNNLLGTYTCQNKPCNYATSLIDDQDYAIDYYKNKTSDINIIQNKYAFIEDNKQIYLYDIANKKTLETYKAVKNYNNMIDYNLMFVENADNKWGVIKLEDQITQLIDYQYDFIGLINLIGEDNLLKADNFIVKKDNLWAVIDQDNDLMSNYLAGEIVSYNSLLISVKIDNIYYLYDYYGKRVIDDKGFNYVSFTDDYLNIVDKNNNLYLYDYANTKKLSPNLKLSNNNYPDAFDSVLNHEKNTIDITIDGKLYSYSL